MRETLRVEGLKARVGVFELGAIDFEVGNEVLAVLGENGAGKTTLLNLIAGMLSPESGRIIMDGMVLNDVPVEKRRTGYIMQRPYLFPNMNVRSNLEYGAESHESRVALGRAVEYLGIGPLLDRRVHELSGGEQQKVAVGRTLVTEPRVLLMDEPLAFLDVLSKRALLREFRDLFSRMRMCVLYVTHDPREAVRIADRVIVMGRGKIVERGNVEAVLENPQSDYVKALLGL